MRGASEDVAASVLTALPAGPVKRAFLEGSGIYPFPDRRNAALGSRMVELGAGQNRTFTFVLAWHFPNAENGHGYATRFADAPAVACYVFDNLDRLAGDTKRWRDTYYDSTLPYWLLDRLHSTVAPSSSRISRRINDPASDPAHF